MREEMKEAFLQLYLIDREGSSREDELRFIKHSGCLMALYNRYAMYNLRSYIRLFAYCVSVE
jgi:hypothetical protein